MKEERDKDVGENKLKELSEEEEGDEEELKSI